MKNIILEELNKAKLLMNYNTKDTLSENLIKNETFISNNFLITEQPIKTLLKSLFGTADEAAIASFKQAGNAKYLQAVKFLDDAAILGPAGFKNVDDLVSAMAKGTLSKAQISGVAKGLLKKGNITGNLRTTLTNKAADLTMKDARYANQSGTQIKNTLTKKGYDPAIADEIALKVAAKRAKLPVDPNTIDDISKNITKTPINFRTAWQSLKKWGLGIGLTLAAIAAIYYFYNSEPLPPDPDVDPNPDPKPDPNTSKYRNCTGTYVKWCKTAPTGPIGIVQGCLGGLVVDGKFGDRTQAALEAKGYSNGFKDSDITKICGGNTPTPPKPEPSPEEQLAQDYGVTPQPNAQAEVQTTNDDINNY
jgi:hypothetical protein